MSTKKSISDTDNDEQGNPKKIVNEQEQNKTVNSEEQMPIDATEEKKTPQEKSFEKIDMPEPDDSNPEEPPKKVPTMGA